VAEFWHPTGWSRMISMQPPGIRRVVRPRAAQVHLAEPGSPELLAAAALASVGPRATGCAGPPGAVATNTGPRYPNTSGKKDHV
jgi:hypothetical protein